jgi:dsDNA-specific endonuclease/ATPase MutS2
VRPDTLQADSLLEDIKRARMESLAAAEQARLRERQAQLLEADLRYQLADIERARREVVAEARRRCSAELDEARKEIEQCAARRATARPPAPTAPRTTNSWCAPRRNWRDAQATEEVNREVVVPGAAPAA